MRIARYLAMAVLCIANGPALRGEEIESDLCIFGGTAAGVSAACTAARLGRRV
jgi:hypothetical protein